MRAFSILVTSILLAACGRGPNYADQSGVAEPLLDSMAVKSFAALPLAGQVDQTKRFWSGDYWALNKGLINYRWFTKQNGFNLYPPGKEEVLGMVETDLQYLSPTEKYDLWVGNYHYPLKQEVDLLANPEAKYWEGICHGWAPAAMNYNEPTPKVMTNPDGIRVPFGSSDIKALISYYYSNKYKAPTTYQMGRRCESTGGWFRRRGPECTNDLNAGTFHIILTNHLGLKKKSFIADIKISEEVWNHPYVSYQTVVKQRGRRPSRHAARGAVESIVVETQVEYLDEAENNTWEPLIGTDNQTTDFAHYKYELELDSSGNIIGGAWISGDRPDFLWTIGRPPAFEGSLSQLGALLDD